MNGTERHLRHDEPLRTLAHDLDAPTLRADVHVRETRFLKVRIVGGGPEERRGGNADFALNLVGQRERGECLEPRIPRSAKQPRLLPGCDQHAVAGRHPR